MGGDSLSCISMNSQKWKVRPQITKVNSDMPLFCHFSIKTSKCTGSCNNINDPYAKMCIPDVKIFNLMSRTNEARHIKWHETCKCKCRVDGSVCNNNNNIDKCRYECKEVIEKWVCYREFIWNPGNCECESDKSCNVGEYLDYESCKCRKKLVDKLVEECTETVEEVKLAKISLFENENKHKCSPCTLHIVLFSIIFTINIGIATYFVYWYCFLKKDVTRVVFGTRTQTIIY